MLEIKGLQMKAILLFGFIFFSAHVRAEALDKVKVGVSPTISSSGLFLAKENGHFSRLNIDAELVTFRNSGAQETALLASNELDVAGGNLSSGLFNAIAGGEGIRIVADKGKIRAGRSYQALIVRADHIKSGRYKTPADLKGMTMALTALSGVSQEIALEKLLQKAGLSLGDVKLIKLAYSEMNLAMQDSKIDATLQLEPYLAQALKRGFAKAVLPSQSIYPNQQSAVLVYSANFRKKRDVALRFMQAYIAGIRDYERALDKKGRLNLETAQKLAKHVNIQDSTLWQEMEPVGLDINGEIDRDGLSNDLLWYKKKSYLSKNLVLSDVLDGSFTADALKIIGRIE
jgi:NitT/TauT family transport system substrate-binding protein